MSKEDGTLTWGQLAEMIGCTRKSLADWRKLPGAPLNREVDVWQSFIDENSLGLGGGVSGKLAGLKEERLTQDIRLKALKIAEMERKRVSMDEVSRLHLAIATKQKATIYAAFGSNLPVELAGKDAGFIRARLLAAADAMCAVMQGELERWTTEGPDAVPA